MKRLSADEGGRESRLSPSALKALQAYSFPGNVRELENILERAMALSLGDVIEIEDLLLDSLVEEASGNLVGERDDGKISGQLQDYLDHVEKGAINEALAKTSGNRTAAARLLGVTFRSLRYRMERLNMKGDKGDRDDKDEGE